MLRGTVTADAVFRAARPESAHLVVGPWSHLPWNRSAGMADLGATAESSIDRAQLRFFDFYLKGQGERPAAVRLFDVGQRQWREYETMPVPARRSLFLQSDGLAATLLTDGRLEAEPGEAGVDRLVHDPSNPAPLIGGHLGTPPGFVSRARADDRADVAVYTSAPAERETLVCGEVVLHRDAVASDAPFDIVARLSLVSATGDTMVLCTSTRRHDVAGESALDLSFPSVCVTLGIGESLRLSVQGGGAPMFAVASALVPPSPQPRPITIALRHGGSYGSSLDLPLI